MKIKFKLFVDYILTSLATSLVDLSFFYFFSTELNKTSLTNALFLATILARIISGLVGYILNKRVVFKAEGNTKKQLIKHFIVLFIQMFSSAFLISYVHSTFNGYPLFEKIVVDSTLFFIFYFVQKNWVYKK